MTDTATIPEVTKAEADAYFATTLRAAAWTAVAPAQDVALQEATRWLMTLCPDPEADGCCGTFTDAWTAAVSELALAIHTSPTSIISGKPTGMLVARVQTLGDLSQEFFAPGEAPASRYSIRASPVLRAFPWLGDIVGCWLTKGGGSAILDRVRS